MTAIAQRIKDLHTYVVAAPASCLSYAERNGIDSPSFAKTFLQVSLQQVEIDLRYLLQDLAGEKLEAPPSGWELGDHAVQCAACLTYFPMVRDAGTCPKCGTLVAREAPAGAEVAPRVDTSIAGEVAM